ncbi:multidrug ABC transporter ATP-binding protein [Ureibacillus massiliensis 4400831 = CIP 108448 = CCUG 49529]|uniref:Multidrug ABC transporter ATP-binding protein n=1 Tax=Ureibacillus massiliensis 4400831 = CIP 108448 = CCUG 49529 TaxID=1211035 RepID=A0A0A3JT42_9BACL|nr:ABC transporter ATP-binding protein [Ureibacillus massiliensis]KGR90192.1 multidrug ABC transporter ATP-binding protein [Ureibacillus massiliensis 4400831 = CIP 108448 = CCUG 49529]
MIKLENVSFSYGNTPALQNVSISETEPIIIGLWGRNGSGKTTLMKILSGMENIDNGSINVNGITPYNNNEAMNTITYIQENHPFSILWNVEDALHFGSLFNKNWDMELANHLVALFELPRKKKIKNFSKGMQTMLQIVVGLASKSPVTIMDEPTNGLDAYMRKQFYDVLLTTYEEDPRLIILSTHHIDEIEALCEKIAIINHQTIVRYENTEELKMRGILLSGSSQSIEALIKDNTILEKRKLGKQINVMIDDYFNDEWKIRAKEAGVTIEKAPLQDYLVNYTTKKEVNEV